MAGQREAKRDLLLDETLLHVPCARFHKTKIRAAGFRRVAEQALLRCLALVLLGCFHRQAHGRKQARAVRIDRVERPGAHHRLHRAAVYHALVDPPAEVEQALERPLRRA